MTSTLEFVSKCSDGLSSIDVMHRAESSFEKCLTNDQDSHRLTRQHSESSKFACQNFGARTWESSKVGGVAENSGIYPRILNPVESWMVDDVFGINEVSRFNRFFQGRDIFARNGETLLSFISDSCSETSVEQNDIVEIFFPSC